MIKLNFQWLHIKFLGNFLTPSKISKFDCTSKTKAYVCFVFAVLFFQLKRSFENCAS